MPENKEKAKDRPEKIYYTIGEVARIFNQNTSLIRFWEKEFSIIKPNKNKKGNRLFTQQDLDNFHIIYHLVKERGYTLSGARQYLKNHPDKIQTDLEILKKLKSIKMSLEELRKNLS